MKGYITNGKCYIFPQTAAEIPAVEATAFYVQEENFAEWVAENESIADKLVKYNYNVITVKPKEWAGHENDDLSSVYDITLSCSQDLIQNLSLNKSKAAEDESITITPAGSSYTAAWVDVTSEDAQITWDNSNSLWSFTMPAKDVTATATTRTKYHVRQGGDYTAEFSVQPSSYMPQHQHQYDSYINLVPSDATSVNPTNGYIMTVLTDGADPQTISNSWSSENSYWYFAMPASDVVATMTHESPEPQNSTITVVIQDTLDGQPYGNPTQISDSYEVGTNQVIDLGVVMLDGTYSNPICSDETFVDWSFDPGNDEDDPETPESEAYNATITITSVPNEDLTFTFEHSLD